MRYCLFSGTVYYAAGGWADYKTRHHNLQFLMSNMCFVANGILEDDGSLNEYDWWHIVDTETLRIVAGSKQQAYGANDLRVDEITNMVKE